MCTFYSDPRVPFSWVQGGRCEGIKKLGFIFIAHNRKANIIFNIWGLLKFDDNKIHNLIVFFSNLAALFAGRPGTDYPILSAVPYTNFYCDEQLYPGFFADMETRCQGEKDCK